jgi:hypothetical protein
VRPIEITYNFLVDGVLGFRELALRGLEADVGRGLRSVELDVNLLPNIIANFLFKGRMEVKVGAV